MHICKNSDFNNSILVEMVSTISTMVVVMPSLLTTEMVLLVVILSSSVSLVLKNLRRGAVGLILLR